MFNPWGGGGGGKRERLKKIYGKEGEEGGEGGGGGGRGREGGGGGGGPPAGATKRGGKKEDDQKGERGVGRNPAKDPTDGSNPEMRNMPMSKRTIKRVVRQCLDPFIRLALSHRRFSAAVA